MPPPSVLVSLEYVESLSPPQGYVPRDSSFSGGRVAEDCAILKGFKTALGEALIWTHQDEGR